MTVAELVETFVLICEADENTDYVDERIAEARDKLAAGKGVIAPLTSTNLNSKGFTRSVQFSCAEVIRAGLLAKRTYADEDGPGITFLDFGGALPTR